ncbi:probable protein ABIL5 [Morus notabilis]|uniref:probable protein ABIL5 n=1 Tax=Morus notabilis TaxID=981085 RepID=UPI000CECEC69|nr:probable protein ABIL5 [Morus notabilis]
MFSLEKDLVSKFSDDKQFGKSLLELRDLRSQLHNAADYCETTFLNAQEKKDAVESTKEYVCRAMVTVVDHLGCVSDNLNALISHTNSFSDAELRINSLKQRFLLSEQYAHKLALNRLRWKEIIPRHHPRYLSTQIRDAEKSDEDLRDSKNEVISTKTNDKDVFEKEADMPLFVYTFSHKAALSKDQTNSPLMLPVRDGLSILSKAPNPLFHFQEKRKIIRSRRSHGNDILSLIRRTKRTT